MRPCSASLRTGLMFGESTELRNFYCTSNFARRSMAKLGLPIFGYVILGWKLEVFCPPKNTPLECLKVLLVCWKARGMTFDHLIYRCIMKTFEWMINTNQHLALRIGREHFKVFFCHSFVPLSLAHSSSGAPIVQHSDDLPFVSWQRWSGDIGTSIKPQDLQLLVIFWQN